MDIVTDPEWQKAHKTFDHVAASTVAEVYESYAESLDIRGHPETAHHLGSRVDLALCTKFPKLLLIIKALANLDTNPAAAAATFSPVPHPTWDQILAEEPLRGDHWAEQVFSSDSQGSEDELKGGNPTDTAKSDREMPARVVLTAASSVLVIPDLPKTLSQTEFIQEIKYQLMGYSSLLPYSTVLLPKPAIVVLSQDVRQLTQVLDSIRTLCNHPFAGYAFESIRTLLHRAVNSHQPTTVLAAMAYFKQLIMPYTFTLDLPSDYMRMLEKLYTTPHFELICEPFRAQVSAWCSTGVLGPMLSVYQPSLDELVNETFEISLPNFLDPSTIFNAGRYAVFLRAIGAESDHSVEPLVMDYSLEIQILQLEKHNIDLLLAQLRPQLLQQWAIIAPVYLVLDTRLVEFALKCASQGFEFDDSAQFISILGRCWPGHPFELDKMIPEFEFPNNLVRLLLPIDQLKDRWLDTLIIISKSAQAPSTADSRIEAVEAEAYNRHTLAVVADQISQLQRIKEIQLPTIQA